MQQYDRFMARRYLRNALRGAQRERCLRAPLFEWMVRYEHRMERSDAKFVLWGLSPSDGIEEDDYLAWAIRMLDRSLDEKPSKTAEARVTTLLVSGLGFDGASAPLLELIRHYGWFEAGVDIEPENLWTLLRFVLRDHRRATAFLLGVPERAVERAIRRLGYATIADPRSWEAVHPDLSDYVFPWLERIYAPPVTSSRELRQRLEPHAEYAVFLLEDDPEGGWRKNTDRIPRSV